ncbi:MAG TPA: chemotaxis response regulator protein-glutamate methylesterase [bacterium]|nr:chemotaxis response regulator protein-glutamate methylesterase [bacterium]
MAIKVLIVDDSPVVREVLSRELGKDSGLQVVGTAHDALIASDKIEKLNPDVLTLDIGMPRMDGLTFLRGLMKHHPMPVVVVSALTAKGSRLAMDALDLGAVDIVQKPGEAFGVSEMAGELIAKIKAAGEARVRTEAPPPAPAPVRVKPAAGAVGPASSKIVAIGASTGGTQALQFVLTHLPANIPATLIVQHMPAGFTRAFADRLNGLCPFEVKEAEDGDAVLPGRVLIAPGNLHMLLARQGSRYVAQVKDGPKVSRQRPAVEVLFQSVAREAGAQAVGVILTGMGGDGAEGMLEMKKHGARTVAQDEQSCVVFGMPREAIRLGGVDQILPLDKIPDTIMALA